MPEKPLPNYDVVPLRSDEVRVALVQSRLGTIDASDPGKGKKENLDHMLWLVDYAQARSYKDLVTFHEFPIGGLSRAWGREQSLRAAIEVPGPETEAVGRKAREFNCYILFGCYARLPDWPCHFINMGVMVGPNGDIVYRRWWLRNLAGVYGFATPVYDVLDEYVKRYGWDAVFPVARTDIGNIATMSEVLDPEIRRAFALRGAEIGIHYMVSGMPELRQAVRVFDRGSAAARLPEGRLVYRTDFQAACMANSIYGLYMINAVSEADGKILDAGVGNSAIFDCNGNMLAEAPSHHECVIEATIPIAAYRKRHSIPRFYKELFTDLYARYTPKFPPGSFLKSLPENMVEAAEHYKNLARW